MATTKHRLDLDLFDASVSDNSITEVTPLLHLGHNLEDCILFLPIQHPPIDRGVEVEALANMA